MNDLNKTAEYSQEIKAWLESGKDFDAGYLLFVRFSHNRAMALQFARKGASMQSKLEYELLKILERNMIIERPVMPIGPVIKAIANAVVLTESGAVHNTSSTTATTTIEDADLLGRIYPTSPDTHKQFRPADLPEPVRILYDENSEKHKLMRSVHEQMKLAKKDDERAKLREELISLDDRVTANWKAIDAFLENGTLPEVKETKAAAPGTEMYKQINAARSYVSRGLNGLHKKTGKKRDETIAEIKKRFDFLVANKAEVKKETFEALQKLGITNEISGDK